MPVQKDFDAVTAAALQSELERFAGQCWYDETRRRVVYRSDTEALEAYMTLQREEMERHKWIESEKAHRDLQDGSLADWVRRHSNAFAAYWHRTHAFIRSRPSRPAKVG